MIDSNRYTVIDSNRYIVIDSNRYTAIDSNRYTIIGMRGTISACYEKTENMGQSAFPVAETALPVSCGTKPGQQDSDLGTSPLMVVMSRH